MLRLSARLMSLALAIAGLCFCWLAPGAAADWRFYGKDLANSRDAGGDGPSVEQARTLAEAWRFQSDDGSFTGTPVVAGGTLVVGSSGGRVFALDSDSGRPLWTRDFNEWITGSAAIWRGRVYVPISDFDTPRIAALRLSDGALLWDRVIDRQDGADLFGSPVVYRGTPSLRGRHPQRRRPTVYIGVSAYLASTFDPNVSTRGSVVALDARTGRRRWKTHTVPAGLTGGGVWSTAAIDRRLQRLFVGTGQAYQEPAADTTDSILAISLRDGRIVRHFQATPNDVWNGTTNILAGPDHDFGASPNLFTGAGGRRLVGEGQKSGTYWALDRRTLEPVWKRFTGPGSFMGGIVGSTAYDGARIYGPDTIGGELWALDRAGQTSWVTLDGGPLHFSPVTVANGVIYTGTLSGFLSVREAATGTILSRPPLNWGSFGGVSVSDGTVYATTGTLSETITGVPTVDFGFVVAFRPR